MAILVLLLVVLIIYIVEVISSFDYDLLNFLDLETFAKRYWSYDEHSLCTLNAMILALIKWLDWYDALKMNYMLTILILMMLIFHTHLLKKINNKIIESQVSGIIQILYIWYGGWWSDYPGDIEYLYNIKMKILISLFLTIM